MLSNTEVLEKINERIGDNIKRVRKIRGFSREQLGRKVGIKGAQIYKYELGYNNITAARLMLIAFSLNERIEVFLNPVPAV